MHAHATASTAAARRSPAPLRVGADGDFAAIYAEFAAGLTADRLPAEALAAARRNLLDTVACATAGRTAQGVCEVLDLVRAWGGAPQASLWGEATRVPAHHAAWANGVVAHARDYDDTHDGAVLHAGVSVVPAALAAAELRGTCPGGACSGAELITGIAAGLELVCRLGIATRIGIIESGFIYSSLFGCFGAAAAAARVLGLDARRTLNAIGIAYSQAAGTHQVTRDAATTKRMQPGLAAKAAILAVELARRDVRGAQEVFEGVDGLFATYLRGQYDPEALRRDLGRRWEFIDLSYKPYPCCRFDHTAIDAALAVRAQPGFHANRVRRIAVGVNRQAYEAVCTPAEIRTAPRTVVQAQFSIPWTVACALTDGAVRLGHFTDDALKRPEIQTLARRVECRVDEAIERDWGRSISPARLVVETEGGVFTARVDHPRGHPQTPMTPADFDAKLRDCLAFGGGAWAPGTADRLTALVAEVERLEDARTLVAVLTPEGGR
jgi:2-methylcitrate dehydratase PrpD